MTTGGTTASAVGKAAPRPLPLHSTSAATAGNPATPTASVTSGGVPCASCWGLTAPTIEQGIVTAINHLFNNAFNWLSGFPANPISDFVEGSLVLIRRSLLGIVPTGVSATQTGNSLTIAVNTGSVAYFRNTGSTIEVAGDPSFWHAQQFAATSVTDVVTNANGNGNAGCAGFWFSAGSVDANLTTHGIDSLEFGSTATFLGAVTASGTPGALVVSGAVRGLNGVTLNGPVVLARDTEVDAGNKDANFNGAVDGQGWFGGQSLTVTALGTTTFAGNVGSSSPLGALITRGVAPLVIAQSADSKTIPLYFMPIPDGSGGFQNKYGIDVAIGNNPARRYLFDTGGNGFFANYTPGYWDGTTLGQDPVNITYSSGGYLDGYATNAVVTIGTGSQTVSTGQPVLVSAVTKSSGFFTPGAGQPTNPYAQTAPFAGDFGAAFGVQQVGNQQLYTPGSFITSPLFQLPGNLSSGYLVQAGPIGTNPQLTVGITDALRAQFPYAVSVKPVVDPAGTYPVSGYPILQQFGFYPTYSVTAPGGTPVVLYGGNTLQSLADTGAASTNVRLPDPNARPYEVGGQLAPGTTFTAQIPTTSGTPLTWQFVAGDNSSVNEVAYTNGTGAATPYPNVNTGLNMFNDFDMMFDVESGLIWLRPNGGQSTVNLRSVTTRGAQTYGQNAMLNGTYSTGGGAFSVGGTTTLAGNTAVDTNRGNATFSGTVDAANANVQWLQVNSRGRTTFVRAVGGQKALGKLTTTGGGSTVSASVTTDGAQSYGGDATLNGAYTTNSGAFSVAGSTTIAGPTSVATTGAPITFGQAVDSVPGAGTVLTVSAKNSSVQFNGAVGAHNALGGLAVSNTDTVTAARSVTLDGSLPQSQSTGLSVGKDVTAVFSNGGSIANFTGSGVVFQGDSQSSAIQGFTVANNVYDGIQFAGQNYTGTLIANNTIIGNSAFGVETLGAVNGLSIRNNTIGAVGTSNNWGYAASGPNAQGIVLAAGNYTGTVIAGNTIQYNRRSGIAAPDGVQGVLISGNTVQYNGGAGIDFSGGDFTGTIVTGNTIVNNHGDGISLGAGLQQALDDYGNPLSGYQDSTGGANPYAFGHYVLHYANDPGFYTPTPADPQVAVSLNGASPLIVNLDTGSRGLYFDQYQVPNLDITNGTPGYIYLNSSNRLYFGTWVKTTVTFPQSQWVGAGGQKVATAEVPVLVVTAVGASMTPPPGSTSPTTTFQTTTASGTVTITNGSQTQQVPIQVNTTGGQPGFVTIPGGWWANYADNRDSTTGVEILAPVANFGVGFDRSGLGTAPTTDTTNQGYNAFLNLSEMQAGTMRPGYVITADGVTLGLDSSVTDGGTSYAYTDLNPSGLAQDGQTAPDWQPATGQVKLPATSSQPQPTGPVVIDIGIATGILTLPAQSPSSTFTGPMSVDLLNSGGKISYTVDPTDQNNQMTATSVSYFDPLAGVYSQNMPPLSSQFFNTGRRVIAGMNYLYDAAGGYLGLYAPVTGDSNQAKAFASAGGVFEAQHFTNPTIPAGVTNLSIQGNTIGGNGRNGVTVNGSGSSGNAMYGNSIYGNAGQGIALTNGGNGGQPTPVVNSATASLVGSSTIRVTGSVAGSGGYSGPFQVQVFASPTGDASNVQGRQLLGTVNTTSGDFTADVAAGATIPGYWITVVATPVLGAANSSQFSQGVQVTT
ncbi:right-handed parallel beta-helix repeat-containing protein [Mycolicibacterium sp. CH28]|uniref:beta strand repeat-containing protein n=1 Tax=Mycolicibacterium sp. CH28 TaxID=2512237 RepID=UPI0010803A3E|nr:right-handed parallel beta-helix repeat-containing protein [Mycolicibacterium sp. CH28]TGD88110.1 right-handed parallel beta-helix repeat-containing protein [Mycolicibacterium sp. CH28]